MKLHPSRLNLDLTGNESAKNCSSMDTQAFEKFENAVFFKIFKIPSDRYTGGHNVVDA